MPTPNIALFDRIITEVDPKLFEPDNWAARRECGTTHCTAGWAIALTHPDATYEWRSFEPDNENGEYATYVTLENGEHHLIERYARQLLGVTGEQAQWIFYRTYRFKKIQEIRDLLAVNPEADLGDLFLTDN